MTAAVTALANAQAATQVMSLRDLTASIINTVRTKLTEDFREAWYWETAADMFPPKKEGGQEVEHELSAEDDRAITARIREDVEEFKSTLDAALAQVPTEEEGFFDPRGHVWRAPDPRRGSTETPLKAEWHVFAMFDRNSWAVAVYAFPVTEIDAQGKPVPFARILLSRHVASASWKPMGLDAFKREIVEEMIAAYYDFFGKGGHLAESDEEDDDDDDEEDDAEPETSVPSAPSASASSTSAPSGTATTT